MSITSKQIEFSEIKYFSSRDKSYTQNPEIFKEFIRYIPVRSSFREAIENKSNEQIDRITLVNVLKEQYRKVNSTLKSEKNINALLDENTFTIVTAHQPVLFTGPLYVIYKIISAINTCEKLKDDFPDNHFVPIFISGGEDHDFEEINHFNFFQKRFEWENTSSGPVGRMEVKGLDIVLDSLKEKLGNSENAEKIYTILKKGLLEFPNYGDYVFHIINEIFGKYGLVFLNMDHKILKKSFVPYFEKELLNRKSKPIIESAQKAIADLGFKSQAHAREINLFYLQDGRRDRIELVDNKFMIVGTDLSFSENEIIEELHAHPERFSPNVILRPLYQEKTLPNLAYIGGGGELAYWLERKAQFEYFDIQFPILMRRNSVQWIDSSSMTQLRKFDISEFDIFKEEEMIIKDYVTNHTEVSLDISEEKQLIINKWKEIVTKAKSVDPTFSKSLLAEMQKLEKNIDHISQRFIRIEKQKKETEINKIRKLKEKLFPANGLQERYDNYVQYYFKYGDSFIQTLKSTLDPFDNRLTLLIED